MNDFGFCFPFIVIKIFAIHFDFAALEIGWFRAHRFFGGNKFASPIEVHDHAIAVLMAAVEISDARVIGFFHAVGSIGRQPTPRRDVDFGPVVHAPIVFDGFGFVTALPSRRARQRYGTW